MGANPSKMKAAVLVRSSQLCIRRGASSVCQFYLGVNGGVEAFEVKSVR